MYSKKPLLQTTFYVSTTAVSLDYYFLAISLVLTSSRSVIYACVEIKNCIPPGLIVGWHIFSVEFLFSFFLFIMHQAIALLRRLDGNGEYKRSFHVLEK